MSTTMLLIIILVVVLVGTLPRWNYSTDWGYTPASTVGLIIVVLIILALLGKF